MVWAVVVLVAVTWEVARHFGYVAGHRDGRVAGLREARDQTFSKFFGEGRTEPPETPDL
jgi:hypothetical protein